MHQWRAQRRGATKQNWAVWRAGGGGRLGDTSHFIFLFSARGARRAPALSAAPTPMASTAVADLLTSHPLLAARAAAVGFGTAGDILLAPPLALSERLDLDAASVEALVGAAAAAVAGGMGRQTVRA